MLSSMIPRLRRMSRVVIPPLPPSSTGSIARIITAIAGILSASKSASSTPSQMEATNFLRFAAPQKSKKRLMTLTIVLHLHMGLPHLFIQAVMGEQLLMRAAVLDIAVVHDIDPVRVSDGGKPVGDDDQRLARRQL